MELLSYCYIALAMCLSFGFLGTYSFANRVIYGFFLSCILIKFGMVAVDGLLLILADFQASIQVVWHTFCCRLVLLAGDLHRAILENLEVSFVALTLGVIVIGVIVELWARRGRVLKRYSTTYEPDFVPEKMVPGSQFQMNAPTPKFQVEIYGSIDGDKYYPVGQGFWAENYIITAAHVVYDFKKIKLVKDAAEVEVEADHFKTIDGDLALLPVQPGFTSKLKLAKAKLAHVGATKNGGLMAQVVAFGQRSFGFINPYEQFGYCSYGGSTIKGFSGAPYYLNNTVFGMHLGGNLENLGYEGSYIRSLLKPSATITSYREDSEEWLIDMASRETEFLYERSPVNPDEYKIKIRGSYHVVDDDVMRQILNKSRGKQRQNPEFDAEAREVPRADTTTRMRKSVDLTIPEIKEELSGVTVQVADVGDLPLCPREAMTFKDSGNLIRAPASAGARGQESDPAGVPKPAMPTSNPMVSTSQTPLAPSHMESRKSMPAAPRGASQSTASRRKRAKKSNAQRIESLEELLSKLVKAMEDGRPISPPQAMSMIGSKESLTRLSKKSTTTVPQATAV